MIFAAGLGTRLKPITDTLPKALVPVAGKPLIEHVMSKIAAAKGADGGPLVDGFVVNVHHFADKLVAWLKEYELLVSLNDATDGDVVLDAQGIEKDGLKRNVTVEISDETAMLLETGGAVHHARKYLDGCGSFLIHNVDIFTSADLSWFATQHRLDSIATLMVSDRKTSRYFLFNPEDMRLVGWYNSTNGDTFMADPSFKKEDCRMLAFAGIHVLSDKVFGFMDEYIKEKGLPVDEVVGTRFPVVDFYLWLCSEAPVYGVEAQNLTFLDVGKMETIDRAEEMLAKVTEA